MIRKITSAICFSFILLMATNKVNAQFLHHIPGVSSYIRSDVQAELGGLTFNYLIQDSTLAIYTYLIHTDNNGQTLWMKKGGNNFGAHYVAPDSSVLIAGSKSTSAGNRIAILQKVDKNGNIVWIKSIASTGADVGIGNLSIGSGDTIMFTATRSNFSSSTYYSRSVVMAFTGAGNLAWSKTYANGSFTTDYGFSRAIRTANGDFVGVADIRGSSGASANGMMVTRIKQNGTIVFSKYVNFLSTHNQLSVTGLTETSDGKIIFGGRLMTDQISTYTNTMWMAKMDDTGQIILQKNYHGGTDVGEQLHSLRSHNGKTYAYVHQYSPFDSVRRSFWIGELNEGTLSFTSQNATRLDVTTEDPYGNVRNAFCVSSNGKLTAAGGFFCADIGKNIPMMMQYNPTLSSSCAALDVTQPMIDSVTSYPVTAYTSAATVTLTVATDTTQIRLVDTAAFALGNLCNGCSSIQPPNSIPVIRGMNAAAIHPNPGNGIFSVDFAEPMKDVRLSVFNNLGVLVYQQTHNGQHHKIDLSGRATGIYYLQIRTFDGQTSVTKLLKDR